MLFNNNRNKLHTSFDFVRSLVLFYAVFAHDDFLLIMIHERLLFKITYNDYSWKIQFLKVLDTLLELVSSKRLYRRRGDRDWGLQGRKRKTGIQTICYFNNVLYNDWHLYSIWFRFML